MQCGQMCFKTPLFFSEHFQVLWGFCVYPANLLLWLSAVIACLKEGNCFIETKIFVSKSLWAKWVGLAFLPTPPSSVDHICPSSLPLQGKGAVGTSLATAQPAPVSWPHKTNLFFWCHILISQGRPGKDISGEAVEMFDAVHGAFISSWSERHDKLKHFQEKRVEEGRKWTGHQLQVFWAVR